VASLPHYALALALPTGPVALHDEWVDPIGTSAATLLPEALEPTVESHSALRAVTLVDGRAIATIETRARIETPGPRLALAGSAEWDLLDGRLISRSLEIRPSRLGESEGNPGVLAVHLTTPRA
ncbi:MAG: hypothetical protein KC912_26885, partial [Proteobacteria bacterium]|nr:hypothetical protein [Pseudomonadota bacterium]